MSPQSSPKAVPTSPSDASPSRQKALILRGIAVCVLAAAGSGLYLWQTHVPPIHALTVRPFSAEGGPEWLAGAITEEVIDALRPIVKPGDDSAVLSAAVSRSGDRVRVIARLTRADGHQYWTRTI